MRRWNIQIFLLNEHGEEIPASIFSKVVYKLHPTFEKRAVQGISSLSYASREIHPRPGWLIILDGIAFTTPPFRIQEEGWGEFDIEIVLTAMDKGGEYPLVHDLNFQSNRYEAKHTIVSSGSSLVIRGVVGTG